MEGGKTIVDRGLWWRLRELLTELVMLMLNVCFFKAELYLSQKLTPIKRYSARL